MPAPRLGFEQRIPFAALGTTPAASTSFLSDVRNCGPRSRGLPVSSTHHVVRSKNLMGAGLRCMYPLCRSQTPVACVGVPERHINKIGRQAREEGRSSEIHLRADHHIPRKLKVPRPQPASTKIYVVYLNTAAVHDVEDVH